MVLQNKYQSLIDAAKAAGVTNFQAKEQDGIFYVDGEAPTGAVKDQLWDMYGKIDPDFRAGDLVMNINVSAMAAGSKAKVTTETSNLNIRKGPGTDQPIVGKAAHNEIVTLVSKSSDQWWLIRTDAGEEGYSYARYLTVEG